MFTKLSQLPTGKRIIKNFLSLTTANIVSHLINFITIAYLARVLNANAFGKISFAQAITVYFMLLTDSGLRTFGIREVARHKKEIKSYANNILTLRTLLAAISFTLLLVFLACINKPMNYKILIAFFGISLFPSAFLLDWIFQGTERMELVAIANIVRSVTYASLVLLFVKGPSQILNVPLYFLTALSFMAALLIYFFTKNHGLLLPSFDTKFWKKMLIKAIPMGFSFIMIQIYYNIDMIMLGFIKGDEAVGWYTSAYKIILLILSFGGLFVQTIFPLISRYYKQSKDKLTVLLNGSAKLMISIAIPLGIGGFLLANPIMNLIYGPEYQNGIIAFQILIWTVAIIFVSVNFGNSLIACDGERKYAIGVTIGAGTNIILNFLLIPPFGLVGASIATLTTEIVVLIYMAYHFGKIIRIRLQRYILKPCIAGVVMGAVLLTAHVDLLLSLLIGVIVYFTTFLLIKGVDEADIRLVFNFFGQ